MSNDPTGYSGTPLGKKLGLKPGMSLLVINAPTEYFDKVEIPKSEFLFVNKQDQKADFIHVFATDSDELANQLEKAIPSLKPEGMLWISWPKGVKTFNREDVRSIGLATRLVDIKVAAFDEKWSGLKFVYRVKDR
jgi:hypothetical protein